MSNINVNNNSSSFNGLLRNQNTDSGKLFRRKKISIVTKLYVGFFVLINVSTAIILTAF